MLRSSNASLIRFARTTPWPRMLATFITEPAGMVFYRLEEGANRLTIKIGFMVGTPNAARLIQAFSSIWWANTGGILTGSDPGESA